MSKPNLTIMKGKLRPDIARAVKWGIEQGRIEAIKDEIKFLESILWGIVQPKSELAIQRRLLKLKEELTCAK